MSTLSELAAEYRESAALCRDRAAKLARELPELRAVDARRLRVRINELRAMERDCLDTAAHLERYYRHTK